MFGPVKIAIGILQNEFQSNTIHDKQNYMACGTSFKVEVQLKLSSHFPIQMVYTLRPYLPA